MKLSANNSFDLETIKVKVTDKGPDGYNSLRSIYMWSLKEVLSMVIQQWT